MLTTLLTKYTLGALVDVQSKVNIQRFGNKYITISNISPCHTINSSFLFRWGVEYVSQKSIVFSITSGIIINNYRFMPEGWGGGRAVPVSI